MSYHNSLCENTAYNDVSSMANFVTRHKIKKIEIMRKGT